MENRINDDRLRLAEFRGDQIQTMIQIHNYFRGINNHSEMAANIITEIEKSILMLIKEGPS